MRVVLMTTAAIGLLAAGAAWAQQTQTPQNTTTSPTRHGGGTTSPPGQGAPGGPSHRPAAGAGGPSTGAGFRGGSGPSGASGRSFGGSAGASGVGRSGAVAGPPGMTGGGPSNPSGGGFRAGSAAAGAAQTNSSAAAAAAAAAAQRYGPGVYQGVGPGGGGLAGANRAPGGSPASGGPGAGSPTIPGAGGAQTGTAAGHPAGGAAGAGSWSRGPAGSTTGSAPASGGHAGPGPATGGATAGGPPGSGQGGARWGHGPGGGSAGAGAPGPGGRPAQAGAGAPRPGPLDGASGQGGWRPGQAGAGQQGGWRPGGAQGGARGDHDHPGRYVFHGRDYARVRVQPYRYPPNFNYRRWSRGDTFRDWRLFTDYAITDYLVLGFTPPSYGQRWVRYGPDAVLIDIGTGAVLDTVYGVYDDGTYAYGGYDAGYGAGYDAYPPPQQPLGEPAPPAEPYPGTGAPPTPEALLSDNYNNMPCGANDHADVEFTGPVHLNRVELWMDWGYDQTTLSYEVLQDGQSFGQGTLTRSHCDQTQSNWCLGVDTPASDLQPGRYTFRIGSSFICANATSGDNGFIRAYGYRR
jgi:Ni/Co efflux regulator RcnB